MQPKIFGGICLGIIKSLTVLALTLLPTSLIFMFTWNHVIPGMFGFHRLGWLQSWCFLFVASSIFRPLAPPTVVNKAANAP